MFTLPLLTAAQAQFQCPVCYCLYTDPVCLPCAHTFCRECALRSLQTRPQCPLCNGVVANAKRLVTPLPTLAALSTLVRAAAKGGAQYAAAALPATPAQVHTLPASLHVSDDGEATPVRDDEHAVNVPSVTDAASGNDTETCALAATCGTQPLSPLAASTTPHNATIAPAAAPPTLPLDNDSELDGLLATVVTAAPGATPQLDRTARARSRSTPSGTPPPLPIGPPPAADVVWSPCCAQQHQARGTCTLTLRPPLSRVDPAATVPLTHQSPTDAPHTPPSSLAATRTALDQQLCRGTCFLCGLDVSSRAAMRTFLYALLTVRAEASECTPDELSTVTEASLSRDLGPLWALTCARDVPSPHTTGAAPTFVAHQNCLAWSGALTPAHYATPRSHLCSSREAALVAQAAATASSEVLDRLVGRKVVVHRDLPLAAPAPSPTSEGIPPSLAGRQAHKRRRPRTPPQSRSIRTRTGSPHPASPEESARDACARLARLMITGHAVTPDVGVSACPRTTGGPEQACVVCTVCGRPSHLGASVRACMAPQLDSRCRHVCGRYYHLPCALLAGAESCLVFGLDESSSSSSREESGGDDSGDEEGEKGASSAPAAVGRLRAQPRKPPPTITVWCGECYRQRSH